MYPVASRLKSYRKRLCKRLKRRAFHAYCIGVPRTGTTSIAGLFREYYRSGHEVDPEDVLKYSLDFREGKIQMHEFEQFILKRDRDLFLEMDSSTHNVYMIPVLLRLFPQAKFLIPIRDTISWLNSYIDYGINNRLKEGTNVISPQRTRMNEFRYGDLYHAYSQKENILKEFDMPSIEAFLYFYSTYYKTVLEIIPEDRRIIYNIVELKESIPAICSLLGISAYFLNSKNVRMNISSKKHHVLEKIEPVYLQERIDYYCSDMMKRYYPDASVAAYLADRKS